VTLSPLGEWEGLLLGTSPFSLPPDPTMSQTPQTIFMKIARLSPFLLNFHSLPSLGCVELLMTRRQPLEFPGS